MAEKNPNPNGAEKPTVEEAIADFNRLSRKYTYGMLAGIGAGLVVALLFLLLLPFGDNLVAGLMTFLVALILSFAITTGLKNRFFKSNVSLFVVQQVFGPEVTYKPSGGYPSQLLRDLQMFRVSSLQQEDYIAGAYKGVAFTAADVKSYTVHHHKDTTTTEVHFEGVVLTYDFNKPFEGEIHIVEKDARSLYSSRRNFEKVPMESIEFNDNYQLYATDPHQAYYVVTPPLILALINIRRQIKGGFHFKFTGSKLFVTIEGASNHLEAPTFKKFTAESFEKMKAELEPLKIIVDELKLDNEHFEEVDRALRTAQAGR